MASEAYPNSKLEFRYLIPFSYSEFEGVVRMLMIQDYRNLYINRCKYRVKNWQCSAEKQTCFEKEIEEFSLVGGAMSSSDGEEIFIFKK